jgi:hypothetical protein
MPAIMDSTDAPKIFLEKKIPKMDCTKKATVKVAKQLIKQVKMVTAM